jgi:flagellar hook-length control protein FliK
MPETPAIGAPLGSLMGMFGLGAGAEGVSAGGQVGGLFGQLVQGSLTEGQAVSGAGNTPLLVQMLANVASFNSAAGTQPALPLQLGEVNVAVQGTEAEAVQILSQTITILYQRVVTEGVSFAQTEGRTAELANALTALGVPPEEAQAMAKQIETMLALLERELEKMKGEAPSAESSTSLAVMLMAGMLSQTQTVQSTSSVTIETVSIEVSITQSQSIVVRLPEASGNARDVLLGGGAPAPQKPNMVALQTPSTPQVTLDITAVPVDDAPATNALQTPALQVAMTAEANTTETPVALNVPQPTVQKIETPKDIVGKTLYVLKETPTGTTTVQALTPVQEPEAAPQTPTRSAAPEALETLATETAPELITSSQPQTTTQPAVPAMQRFAEQLKQAQQNQVAQQVVVAVQPLLKGEGGAVRMTINPPELGRIEIHLKIEAGQISGAISANEPATVEHLARELPTLKQAFADAGLKLGEQGLSLMLNQNNGEQQRQPNPFAEQQQNAPRVNAAGAGADDASGLETIISSTGPSRWVSPDRVLDREV